MDAPINPDMTRQDAIVLENLYRDAKGPAANGNGKLNGKTNGKANGKSNGKAKGGANGLMNGTYVVDEEESIALLNRLNDPKTKDFEPTLLTGVDIDLKKPTLLNRFIFRPYFSVAKHLVRRDTDVVFLTHILLYMSTTVPSAVILFCRFAWWHAILHAVMQATYMGPFTLMLHNHIHGNGVLSNKLYLFDMLFPYILEPLMGHTWDSYFYHHVKHHHIEANGPEDLSSTIRYQRDELLHFLHYWARFFFLVWIELPIYFIRKGRYSLAIRNFVSEISNYTFIYLMAKWKFYPALFTLILPLVGMRIALMIGNWGQHAFVDEVEPDSDFRSSITVIDVPSNRHCFTDGYHTSHHLNPRRHWRDHPVAFLKAKEQYATNHALVFVDIDFFFVTVRLLMKDYDYLARHMVPIGDQIGKSHDELVAYLKTKTKRFTEEDIKRKYKAQ